MSPEQASHLARLATRAAGKAPSTARHRAAAAAHDRAARLHAEHQASVNGEANQHLIAAAWHGTYASTGREPRAT